MWMGCLDKITTLTRSKKNSDKTQLIEQSGQPIRAEMLKPYFGQVRNYACAIFRVHYEVGN